MTKVTLKELKELQTEIDASEITSKAIKKEIVPWSFIVDAFKQGIDQCRQNIDDLAVEEEKDDKKILEAVDSLGKLLVEHKEAKDKYWKIYPEWKRRYDDSWKKVSRLGVKMNKLKRRYWEEHGIQD